MTKLTELVNWFENKNSVLVALSGGVDSALVAYAAYQMLGNSAIAVTADYKTLSSEELQTSKQVCKEIGIKQFFINYNELENPSFVRNNSDRCFHCRSELGTRLIELSKNLQLSCVVDGTHIDDLGEYRPGIEALKENGIRSPLVETQFSKSQIRETAQSIGLSIYNKPSNSCLASRIPWGQKVTAEKLIRIEYGEKIVKQLTKIEQVRVRDLDGVAKIEVNLESISKFNENILSQIIEKLKLIGFRNVEIDKEGYKPGKINVITD